MLFGRLEGHETELQGLITNFNVFAGALAAESDEPERDDRRARADGRGGAPVAGGALRRAAAVPGAGDRAHPEHRGAAGDDRRRPTRGWRRCGRCCASPSSAASPSCCASRPRRWPRPRSPRRSCSRPARASPAASRSNLVPTGDIVIDDNGGAYPFGQGAAGVPSGRDQLPGVPLHPGQPGRHRPGLRRQRHLPARQHRRRLGALEHGLSAGRLPQRHRSSATRRRTSLGTRPTFTSTVPPYRTDVACHTNPLPDVNGTGGAGLPGDVGPAGPRDGAMRRAIREHLTDFIAIAAAAGGGAGGDRLHPLPAAAAVPVLGPDPRRRPVRGQGRALDRAGGHPGPGPDREHRRGQGRATSPRSSSTTARRW